VETTSQIEYVGLMTGISCGESAPSKKIDHIADKGELYSCVNVKHPLKDHPRTEACKRYTGELRKSLKDR